MVLASSTSTEFISPSAELHQQSHNQRTENDQEFPEILETGTNVSDTFDASRILNIEIGIDFLSNLLSEEFQNLQTKHGKAYIYSTFHK